MDLTTVTVQNFKDRFYRDFTYANQVPDQKEPPTDLDIIQDLDITTAFTQAQLLLNTSLLCGDTGILEGYLLLSAHCLWLNIAAANGAGGGVAFPVASRAVGSVSESYMIPDAYKNSPVLSQYTQTRYGMQYLNLVLPNVAGNVIAIGGATQP